jgi:hypothetical protein
MAVTLNASTTAGLVQTADTSGVLALQTAGTTAVTVDASQNVGIGTASPANKLHVFGTEVRVQQNASYYSLFDTAGTRYGYIQGGSGYLDIVSEAGSANTLRFTANSSERARINTYGIGLGGAVPSSGTGIAFPATQSASTDVNTLDDYEEGTWTPAITFGGGSTGITYSTQLGFYTKIGNTVTVQFRINLSNKGSSTGVASLGGLPFTTGGTYSQNYIIHDNSAGFNAGFGMYWSVENGATSGNLRQIGTNTSSSLSDTNFQNNTFLTGILTYRV